MNLVMRFFDAHTTRSLQRERRLPGWRETYGIPFWVVLVLVCTFGRAWLPSPLYWAATLVVAWAAGIGCMVPFGQLLAYRRGWTHGRTELRKELRQIRLDGHDEREYLDWTSLHDEFIVKRSDLPPYREPKWPLEDDTDR